jgi:hypothetical protein
MHSWQSNLLDYRGYGTKTTERSPGCPLKCRIVAGAMVARAITGTRKVERKKEYAIV